MTHEWIVPVILGSFKDEAHFDLIDKFFTKFNKINKTNIQARLRVCSAHKNSVHLQKIIDEYQDFVPCFITIAGKSNALSAVVDSMTHKPVLACPPVSSKSNNLHDLYSSVMLPSGVSPMLVLNFENCCLAVLKLIGLLDKPVQEAVRYFKKSLHDKIRIDDLKESAKYTKSELDHIRSSRYYYDDYSDIVLLRKGKVRDIYKAGDDLLMRATDRLSAFDRQICIVPYKGEVLNKISIWWFNKTEHIVPNHFMKGHAGDGMYDGMYVTKCTPFMVEFVVRSYMTGSTKTSIWKNYERGMRHYCGHFIRDGYIKNEPLDQVIVTPTTKGETDELIDGEGIISNNLMTHDEWVYCHKKSLELFKFGQTVASDFGMILVDTKYEFGRAPDGTIMLIDEIHTPDSSRYWVQHSYFERMSEGLEPENIDKDIIRKWIKKEYKDPYSMTSKELIVPNKLIEMVSLRYLQLYKIITG